MTRPLRICLIASARFPVAEPFAGGLEAHTHLLASELARRGHAVSLFAAPGSDSTLPVTELPVGGFRTTWAGHGPLSASEEEQMREHHAYLALMVRLARRGHEEFDVVHNNSLHHLPLTMSDTLELPVLTTFHTPRLPWLEAALGVASPRCTFASVSGWTRREWLPAVDSTVVLNGVDLARWRIGSGGAGAVWSGRLVPEKAPHEAIDAARLAGLPLTLVGPVHDQDYVDRCVLPRLGGDVTYAGHLGQADLRRVVGAADVALVSPAWEEPFGLVAAEAMACGTPVAAYARGALPEIVCGATGRLARGGDVVGLARAAREASVLDRGAVRREAVRRLGADQMIDGYERLYTAMTAEAAVA